METLGASAATNSIADLDHAKLILVVGANPAESHPVIGARIKQVHRRGVPLIVIDPRRTELARLADLHLQVRPGTNVALLNAMGHVIVQEGLLNQALISSRTEGVTDWLTSVALCTPEWAEQITGVPAPLIREAARRYATSGASFCVHGLGVTEHRWGSHGVIALCNLALATGNVGRPGTGINPLRGQNNVQGASDVGALPTYFAGYQPFDDPALAARYQALTGRPLPVRRGMKTPEMWEAALEGRLKGLWIVGYDVAQSDPNLKKVREALSKLEFLVVQDLFPTETTKLAHLVLPSASFLEKDGTFTNLERRIQRVWKVVEPPDGVLPDQTRRTAIIQLVDTDALEMHPDDAARLGVSDGDLVKLVSLRGEAVLPVVVSERVLPGELFTSFHFPATDVNVLLSSSADESSKCPEYKVSTVRVEKLAAVGLEGRTAGRTRLIL
jgi:predicted molibdopterin-dependent oxidoreductase YjgC